MKVACNKLERVRSMGRQCIQTARLADEISRTVGQWRQPDGMCLLLTLSENRGRPFPYFAHVLVLIRIIRSLPAHSFGRNI